MLREVSTICLRHDAMLPTSLRSFWTFLKSICSAMMFHLLCVMNITNPLTSLSIIHWRCWAAILPFKTNKFLTLCAMRGEFMLYLLLCSRLYYARIFSCVLIGVHFSCRTTRWLPDWRLHSTTADYRPSPTTCV